MESLADKLERLSIPEPNTGCTLWLGAVNTKGYGALNSTLAHRVAYAEAFGPIPDGMEVNHRCRTRCCVNPAHLEAVTHRQNIDYGVAMRVRCRRGHPFEGDNVYVYPTGTPQAGVRRCRACYQAAARADSERKRARRRMAG